MKTTRIQTLFALVLVAGSIALTLGTTSASESRERKGTIHLVKDTSQYSGLPGGFATITTSDFAPIPVGSKIYYDQAPDIPTGLIDSSVVLDAGNGNRSVGRCTTDLVTWIGLCTFSDGIGTMAGFHARLDVSLKSLDLGTFDLRGTYGFARDGDK